MRDEKRCNDYEDGLTAPLLLEAVIICNVVILVLSVKDFLANCEVCD